LVKGVEVIFIQRARLTEYCSKIGVIGVELDEETGCYLKDAGGKSCQK
jgi:hypothetical protein